ncbi:MAG: hypothetical protein VB089_14170 [Anaerolineaceae bacterium]|nr:hypothetical protein [Anaerolineaceae bacterium]
MPASIIRTLLVIVAAAMLLLAIFYLRGRRLSWLEYGAWGLLALCLPYLGPFLVILSRPGEPRPARTTARL